MGFFDAIARMNTVHVAGFGQSVTYTPTVGSILTISAIISPVRSDEVDASILRDLCEARILESSVPNAPVTWAERRDGDTITINSVVWRVIDKRLEFSMWILILEKDIRFRVKA